MTYIFTERGKIDKAQFILDRSGLVLKTCKIPTAKRYAFLVYHSRKLHMRTPFIRRILKFLLSFQILWPKNFRCAKFYGHTTHYYPTMAKILIFAYQRGDPCHVGLECKSKVSPLCSV